MGTNKKRVHTGNQYPVQCPSTRSRPCTRARAPCPNSGVGTWKTGVFTLVPIKNRSRAPCSGTKCERSLKLHSYLVPEHGARAGLLMGTNVNTPFFQVPTPEFRHGARTLVQGLDLVLGHWTGHQHIGYPVSEHSTILCRCPGTSARAPSVNTALGPVHTYPDIFESSTFSFRIQIPSTRIRRILQRIRCQYATCGRGNFWIRKEIVADSKISGYVYVCTGP